MDSSRMKAIKRRTYRTIAGRCLDLGSLADAERDFLAAVHGEYEGEPEWSAFASWWTDELRQAGLSEKSAAYRICQALHASLVIQPEEDLAERASPERAAKDLAGAAR